ncbi:MBL fold hydrolase [Reticulibacter mediterranei]|uniref:MBL fold hydrolase n=1 Tax=Reticulibacter mediterranei TaxID=2778369 RepID=A0A8J3IYC0_9CHLR|nr:MBL fold metallo-hydrolase [Reticulibacter mediterranei]GHO98311.1 MBL fold hydrolase [Reticulibacter mediterranei]
MVHAAAFQSNTLNDIRITYLPDGLLSLDPMAMFPTSTVADWQRYRGLLDSEGKLVGSLGAYIIQTPGHALLVDAGFGPGSFERGPFKVQGGELLSSLKLARLDPSDIDSVFFTHLHSDHVGWVGRNVDGQRVQTFPNARYLIRDAEWHRFDDPAENRAGVEDALRLLEPRIKLVAAGEQLVPGVTILATPGHTAGHSSLLIAVGQQRAILLGDTFHSAVQMEHPEWSNTFDRDYERAKQARQWMLRELAKPATIGIGTHLSGSVFGRLIPVQDTFRWQEV